MSRKRDAIRDDLLRLRDMLADWLETMDGTVTDRGYAFKEQEADLVVQSPQGTRIEITLRVLSHEADQA